VKKKAEIDWKRGKLKTTSPENITKQAIQVLSVKSRTEKYINRAVIYDSRCFAKNRRECGFTSVAA